MPITTFLFDLDGTLLDSFTLISTGFHHACRTVLGRDLTEQQIVADWGAPLHTRFARVEATRVRDLVNAYIAYYEAHHNRLASLFPGVLEMLEVLKARGCRMGVVTSKRRRTTDMGLRTFNLTRFFDAVVSEEDVRSPKPAPEPVLEALRQLGEDPNDALMVGDGVFDMRAAQAAGVRSVAALWGTREREALVATRPDYAAASPADVVALVDAG